MRPKKGAHASVHRAWEVDISKPAVNVIWFGALSRGDVALAGGKNSSLGEMVKQLGKTGIKVPSGFATTADAYRAYLTANDLDARIDDVIGQWQDHKITLHEAGSQARPMIFAGDWPQDIQADILES